MRPNRSIAPALPQPAPARLPALWLALASALALALTGCFDRDLVVAPEPPAVPLTGELQVTSRFQVPATVAAPGPLGDALRLVHGLATDPGAALLDLAEQAGVPAVGELRLVLPDALEAELTGWINQYLRAAAAGGVSPADRLAELDALIRSVLLDFELRSTLTLPADAAGTHAPVALAFGPPASPVVVPLDASAPVTAGVGVTASLGWPAGSGGPAEVTVGDHFMGIPFGRYALQGLDALVVSQLHAADLHAWLAGAVGCDALAADVAGRCLGPVCVGHAAELEALCRGGVAEGAARLEARVQALDFRALRLAHGRATPAGDLGTSPPAVSQLTGGVWTATIDLGNGAEPATGTFAAAR